MFFNLEEKTGSFWLSDTQENYGCFLKQKKYVIWDAFWPAKG